MSGVPVIVLGNPHAGDDGAALEALRDLRAHHADGAVELVLAGRAGVGLLDLFERFQDRPCVLVDVVQSGQAVGHVFAMDLVSLCTRIIRGENMGDWSSHGFGAASAIRLGHALGRTMPTGRFVGVEGRRFQPGAPGPALRAAYPALRRAVDQAVRALGKHEEATCTSTA